MCGGPKWKRVAVPDHKFDYVDVREFNDNGFVMRMKYLWLYLIVLKSFLVYVSDISTAITMLTTSTWSNEIIDQCATIKGCFTINYITRKWLFVGCIIFSFLLLAYEARKSKKIIRSRDISYAFTNVMANHYYSLRSYNHFCFFDHISNSTKTSDDFAFFVFFTFKSWKQLLLADGPRQVINGLTLYAIWMVKHNDPPTEWYDVSKYFKSSTSTSILTVTTLFTVTIFIGSLLLLMVAGICYVPLLCYIQGNLKEYCCYKVDKRISTVIKRRQKQRLADAAKLARKEARGDFSHLKNKNGEIVGKPLPQPTLPNLSVDDDIDDKASINTRITAPSYHTQDRYYPHTDKGNGPDYPPMPAYNPYSTHQNPNSYTQFNQSQGAFAQDEPPYQRHLYDDDNESTVHLSAAAAPYGQQYSYPTAGAVAYEPHDVYQGHGGAPQASRRLSPANAQPRPSSGLAYDDDVSEHYGANAPGSYHVQGESPYPAHPDGHGYQQSSAGRAYDEDYGRGGGHGHTVL